MSNNIPFSRKRNVGIIAHIDAGKTTTTERFLFYTGISKKIGEVHTGQATMDFMKQEQERGITIGSAATTVPWSYQGEEYQYNLIDTPGHVDFTIEVERSLKVLDGAICVIDAANGVEAQTSTVWKQADRYRVPRILFINKIDKTTASFTFSIDSIMKKLTRQLFIVQIPVASNGTLGNGNDLVGIIDIVHKKLMKWTGVVGEPYTTHEIPDAFMPLFLQYRESLIGNLSAELQMRFLEEGDNLTPEQLEEEIRRQTLMNAGTPVYVGSAYKNTGIEPLLDGAAKYLPNPSEKTTYLLNLETNKPSENVLPFDENGPFVALVFKIVGDIYAGRLIYLRIYSGTMKKGEDYKIARTKKGIRLSSAFKMHAMERTRIEPEQAMAGEIVVITGQTDLITGDTITSDLTKVLEPILIPQSVLSVSIKPKGDIPLEQLISALIVLSAEDPSFGFRVDQKTKQIIIFGMGELHLQIKKELLEEMINMKVETGRPIIQYKESFAGSPMKIDYKHQKQTGGRGQYAHVVLEMSPLADPNAPVEFESKIVGMCIGREFFKPIEEGIRQTCLSGVLTKSIVTGVKLSLLDGSQHSVDSDALSFELCGKYAMTELLEKAFHANQLTLLEPIMRLEFTNVSEENFGNVTGLISSRGGQICETLKDNVGMNIIVAYIPLENTLDIVTALRSCTRGEANYSAVLKQFEQVTERSRIATISMNNGGIMKDDAAAQQKSDTATNKK